MEFIYVDGIDVFVRRDIDVLLMTRLKQVACFILLKSEGYATRRER